MQSSRFLRCWAWTWLALWRRSVPDVTAFRPGDEVFGMVGGVGGLQGTLAEFVVADAALLAPKPKTLTMRQSAALPLVTITAWEGLVDRAGVLPGRRC